MTITVAEVRSSKFELKAHINQGGGQHGYVYGCREHPRFKVTKSTLRGTVISKTFSVDGHVCDTLDQVVELLNGPELEPPKLAPAPPQQMKAFTIWQPWATLIMIGAKPFEFRKWDYRDRLPRLEGKRIVIHAGARAVRREEVEDMIERMEDRLSSLRTEIAMPLLTRLLESYKCQGVVELSAALGTAILGKPKSVSALFSSPADSDRIDHHMWAWPLTDIQPWNPPVPVRGAQGFWNYTGSVPQQEAA